MNSRTVGVSSLVSAALLGTTLWFGVGCHSELDRLRDANREMESKLQDVQLHSRAMATNKGKWEVSEIQLQRLMLAQKQYNLAAANYTLAAQQIVKENKWPEDISFDFRTGAFSEPRPPMMPKVEPAPAPAKKQ